MQQAGVHGGDIYRHPGVLDFSTNMNPLGTPQSVIDAAKAGAELAANYPDVTKSDLISALSIYEQVDPDTIFVGNGAADVIFAYALALKPAAVLIPQPTFAEYEQAFESVGSDICYFDLRETEEFRITDRILPAITDDIDVLVLCNPNNPTGHLLSREFLMRILEQCKRTGTRLLLDECFLDFCEDKSSECSDLLREYPQLTVLKAFTKRYAMAGLRLGYGLTSDSAQLSAMQKCVQPWNVSIPAQMAGVAALPLTDYLEESMRILSVERTFLKNALASLGFTVMDSKANYIFFRGRQGLCEQTLKHGVMIRSCANYRQLDDTWYRVAVRTHEENLQLLEALENG